MTGIVESGCPFCGYDLRGQTEPRCSECGYTFAWEDLRDPQRRVHPILYEHHSERSAATFWWTLLHSMRPRHFWQRIRAEQTVRPRRVLRYVGCIYGLMLILVSLSALHEGASSVQQRNRERRSMLPFYVRMAAHPEAPPRFRSDLQRLGSASAVLDADFPRWNILYAAWEAALCLLPALAIVSLWPVLTIGSLMLLRWSMLRARVTRLHVLRCVAYTSDIMLWQAVVIVGTVTTLFPHQFSCWPILVLHAVAAYRLAAAYRSYMRIDHPLAVGIASQLVVLSAGVSIRFCGS